ncbi:glycosyltransferase family 4 protein [candidate division KSB1 bacterium]|nr:glycosyltransferase family 4 protein [candidate division KSB1 bacterium]
MKLLLLADSSKYYIARWIDYFYARGHELELISSVRIDSEKIKLHKLSDRPFARSGSAISFALRNFYRVARLVRRIQPDIVHAFNATTYGFLAAMSGKKPLILTVTGGDILTDLNRNFLYKFLIAFSLRQSRLVNSFSDHSTNALLRIRLHAKKLLITQHGIELDLYKPAESAIPSQSVLCTGMDMDEADYLRLIMALPIILKEVRNLWLIILATDEIKAKINEFLKILDITNHVAFPELVNDSRLTIYYQNSDIYINTSLSEEHPSHLLQAMACGNFPVVSSTLAHRSWIEDGWNGLLIDPANVEDIAKNMVLALQNDALRKRAASVNAEKVKRLPHADNWLQELEYAYFDLCK